MDDYSPSEESGVIRCICNLTHDDGFTIQCDSCFVWQHTICVQVYEDSVPERYYCEKCSPRELDAERARSIQIKKLGLKKSKAGKIKRPTDRVRKDSISGTRTSSNAPSPTYLTNRVKKKTTKRSTINSPSVFSPKETENEEATNHETLSYDSPDAEQLVNEICQNLHKFKNQLSRRPWETTSTFPPSSLPFPYMLTSESLERDNDYKSVSIMDNEFLEQERAEIEISRASPKGSGKRIVEGLFVRSNVPKDQFVFEIIGKVVLKSAFAQDMDNIYPVLGTVPPEVTFHSHLNLAIDCRHQRGPSNILRRSCTPNAEIRSFFVAGVDTNVIHLGVFAIKDLKDGDEVLVPWTISSGVFPDGLPTDANDLASFRKSISTAYTSVHERYGQNLSPDQALTITNALRRESCPCQKDPPCHVNLLFKYRKNFWSRHKLGSLAGLGSSFNSPKRKPLKDDLFNRDLQSSKVLLPKSAMSDVFDNESLSKPLSGSETEMDSSTQLAVKEPEAANDFEEEYSPSNSTLDVIDDTSLADASQPKSKVGNFTAIGETVKKEIDSSPLEIESNYDSNVEEAPMETQFNSYEDRIGILSTMSLTNFFINKWKFENNGWKNNNISHEPVENLSRSTSPKNEDFTPNHDFLQPISSFSNQKTDSRNRAPPSPNKRTSQPHKKKKTFSSSQQSSKKKNFGQVSDPESAPSPNYHKPIDSSPNRNIKLSPHANDFPKFKSRLGLENKLAAKSKHLDKGKSKLLNKGFHNKNSGETKNSKNKSRKDGSTSTPSLTAKLPAIPRRRTKLSWTDFAMDHSSKLDDPSNFEDDVAPEDILNASQRPSIRSQERSTKGVDNEDKKSNAKDVEPSKEQPSRNSSRIPTPVKPKVLTNQGLRLDLDKVPRSPDNPFPSSTLKLQQVIDDKDKESIFSNASPSHSSPKLTRADLNNETPDSQPQSPDFSLLNPTALIRDESLVPRPNRIPPKNVQSPLKAYNANELKSLPPSPKPTQQSTIYSIKQPLKIPPDVNTKPEMYETGPTDRFKYANGSLERTGPPSLSKDSVQLRTSKASPPFSPSNFEPPEEGEIKPGAFYERSQNGSRSNSPVRDHEFDRDRTASNRYHSQYPNRYNEDRMREPALIKRYTSFSNSYRPGHKAYYESKNVSVIPGRSRYGLGGSYDYDRRGPPRNGSHDYPRDPRDLPRKHDSLRGGRRYTKPIHYREERFADRIDRGVIGPYSRDYRYAPKSILDREDDINGDRLASGTVSPSYSGHRTPANGDDTGAFVGKPSSNIRHRLRLGSPNHNDFPNTSEPSTSNHPNDSGNYRDYQTYSNQRNDSDPTNGRAIGLDLLPQRTPPSSKLHAPSPTKELSS